jgi:hypothetical protein
LVLVEHTFNEDEDYPWSGLFCFSNFKETLQNNDDSCLVHALAALCHLLSEVGTVADSSPKNSCVETVTLPGLDFGNQPSLGMQQQLLLLLRRCLQRALELKLPHLVAFSRLALAKFDLQVIEFPSPDIH